MFNIKIAEAYGINEAIILQNLSFWQSKNEANENNFYDGCYWVYNSVKAFEKLFPYWSKGQINRILKNLEEKEALIVGNYNKSTYDRTKWFSLNQKLHLLISGNGFVEIGKPIPDSKPDSKPDIEDIPTREAAFKDLVKQTWADLGGEEFLPNIEAQKFFLHFSECSGTKMAFEKCKTFDIRKRMHKWKLNGYSKQSYSEGRSNA